MNPLFHTDFSISDSLKSVRKNVLIYETIIKSLYDRVIDGNYEHYYERFVMFLNDIRANDRMPTEVDCSDALCYQALS